MLARNFAFFKAARFRLALLVVVVCCLSLGAILFLRSRKHPIDYNKLSDVELRALVARQPSLEALGSLFQRTYNAGSNDEALTLAQEMVKRYPNDARGQNALGIIYSALGNVENARKAFQNAIALEPRRIDPYLNLGRLALLAGDNQQAMTEFDRATTVDSNSAAAWTGMGEAHASLFNMSEAIENYKRAIRLAPDRARAYVYLGLLLAEYQRSDEALPYLKRAQELGDRSAALYAGLAMANADQAEAPEQLTQALNDAAEAEKQGDASGLVYYARAMALQKLGRYAEAITAYHRVIASSSNANGAWIGISQCYRAQGKMKMADEAARIGERVLTQRQQLANLQHEIRANPNRLDFREKYAGMLMANGQYLIAANEYRYVAQHTPEKPAKWLKAAVAFDKAGEKQLANEARQAANEKPMALSKKSSPDSEDPAGKLR